MDYIKAQELSKLANSQINFAGQYKEAREKSGIAKSELDILLAANLLDIRKKKSNVGYEMALLMLMESNEVAKDLYKVKIEEEARYKGLEKMIDSLQSKISLSQSVMKYIDKGEKFGG